MSFLSALDATGDLVVRHTVYVPIYSSLHVSNHTELVDLGATLSLRNVSEMHYWEQLDAAEIAEVLAIAPGTVRTRLHRAREALRVRLAELDAGREVDSVDLDASLTQTAAAL